jgi:hypothetical protein
MQEAQAAERSAVLARRAADERAASASEQETRIAAAQAEHSAAQQRLQREQAQLAVSRAHLLRAPGSHGRAPCVAIPAAQSLTYQAAASLAPETAMRQPCIWVSASDF